MAEIQAIKERHSVRQYTGKGMSQSTKDALLTRIQQINSISGLHIQLVTDEPKAFSGPFAKYGKFTGVVDYLVIAGAKGEDLDRKAGYYGEELVILAQTLGLNSCWAGLTYSKIDGTFSLGKDEKIVCFISLGYGQTQGVQHVSKPSEKVSNLTSSSPDWFRAGIEAAQLCPTAVNQQKYRLTLKEGTNIVKAETGFSMIGYAQVDLGIAMYHFEIGAGKQNFVWEKPIL